MMASRSTQPSATANRSVLTPVMTLKGHEPWSISSPNGKLPDYKCVTSISYFPDGKQMISGSGDKTIRRWDLREGKEIEEAKEVFMNVVEVAGVSRDGRWVVTAGREVKVREVETGIVRTFHEGKWLSCIDVYGQCNGTDWSWVINYTDLLDNKVQIHCSRIQPHCRRDNP
jgi:WD40 repeat protein